jgi:hypothetical protein
MAELGDIGVVEVHRGVTPVTRGAEVQALGTALDATAKTVDAYARDDLLGDLAEAEQQALAIEAGTASGTTFDEFKSEHYDEKYGTAITSFVNQMRKYEALATQATSSGVRTNAQLLMQQALQKASAKYPWMRAELAAEANRYMSSSPSLTEMGLYDGATAAQRQAEADAAQTWIDETNKYARDVLRIDRRIPFGSVEFSRQYDIKERHEQAKLAAGREAANYQAQVDKDVREGIKIAERQLEKTGGMLSTFYDDLNHQLEPLRNARREFLAGTRSEVSLLHIQEQFNIDVLQSLDGQIALAQTSLRNGPDEIFTASTYNDPSVQAVYSRVEEHIEDLQIMRDSLASGNMDITEMIDTFTKMRGRERLDQAPTLSLATDIASVSGAALKLYADLDFSFESAHTLQQIADGMGHEISGMFSNSATALLDVAGAATPEEIRIKRNQVEVRSTTPGGSIESREPLDILGDTARHADEVRAFIAEGVANDDPVAAAMELNVLNRALQTAVRTVGDQINEQELSKFRGALAHPNMIDIVNAAGRDSLPVRELVDKIEKEWNDVMETPDKVVGDIINSAMRNAQTIGAPVSTLELMDINYDQLADNGAVEFVVNRKAIEAAFPISDEDASRTNVFGENVVANQVQKKRRRAIEIAQEQAIELSKRVTDYIRIQGLLNYAKSRVLTKPEYGVAFFTPSGDNSSLALIFGVMDDFDLEDPRVRQP